MNKPRKKFRVNKKQTQRLLKLSLHENKNTAQANSDVQKEQLLLDILRSKLPLEHSLPNLIQSIARELKTLSGAPLGTLLANPNTKTDTLIKLKDHAKTQGNAVTNEIEREVALTVYYAAIASALAYHDAKISEHSYKSLKEAFSKLVQNAWIPANLLSLFQAALGHSSLESESLANT
jgi:hypothetical protein